MPRQFVTWHTAQTPHGPCSWAVVDGLLHVRSALGTKIAVIGGLTPESLARLLIWEMARDRSMLGVRFQH